MEAGVDFLRITRVLRAQTQNPRLLEIFEQLDRDMKMGEPLSDALARAPDLFSPFAISLIRSGRRAQRFSGRVFQSCRIPATRSGNVAASAFAAQ